MSRTLDVDGPFGRFSRRLLVVELPELPPDRLDDTVTFVCRRARQIPGPLQLGVTLLSLGVGLGERFVDPGRVVALMRSTSLPFVGELARLVRSLAFAFIWETWPETSPVGATPTTEAR